MITKDSIVEFEENHLCFIRDYITEVINKNEELDVSEKEDLKKRIESVIDDFVNDAVIDRAVSRAEYLEDR